MSPTQTTTTRKIDIPAAVVGAEAMIRGLGIDIGTADLRRTPERLVRALAELLVPKDFEATTFPNTDGFAGPVTVCDIPMRSICEHHLLPFVGTAHVSYIPGERLLGLSKVARAVDALAARPQVQERLTQQLLMWFTSRLSPIGVGVAISAEHTCMTLRGVKAAGATTITSAFSGSYVHDETLRAEVLAHVRE
ncbi:GTP cyclohydrolase I [Microbacterium sp.]|uniref:GTP cyclohydrolase I n=1 Tax=Microbacterium sp. TaxID=51671 RepID=UPI0039E6E6C0